MEQLGEQGEISGSVLDADDLVNLRKANNGVCGK